MPTSTWTGSIGFGLVSIPIKLFRAQSPKDIHFHQLHAQDGARIQQKRVCPIDGQEITFDEIVKGYEVSSNQYIVIDQDELSALDPKATRSIEIIDFVDLNEIDPLYYENGYYAVPDTRAEKPYALLVAAMSRSNRVAIARFVMRTKEYLCAVRAKNNVLVVETMLFTDELVDSNDLLPESLSEQLNSFNEPELSMAMQLIDSLVAPFAPEKYHDEYREKVLGLINAKAEGNEIVAQPAPPAEAPIIDLTDALEASIAASEKTKVASKKAK